MVQEPQILDGSRKAASIPRTRVFVAGMVVAAALGGGLGVWARTAPPPSAAEPEPEPPRLEPLQIVVDDTLPPIGQLIEVLPQEFVIAANAAQAARPPLATPVALPSSTLPVVALRPAEPPVRMATLRIKEAQPKDAKATRKKKSEPAAKVVKASTPNAKPAASRTAPAPSKADKAKRKSDVRVADARSKKPEKARKPSPKPPVKLAKAEPAQTPKAVRTPPRGEGPLRVAGNTCAHTDPGAALVCADQRLGARDRQLQRAYRRAEAAGVPTSAIRRRESRWLEVRAAAAREAPWAVEDVYVARISEINDMIRDAREN